ncbi:DUF167 domain-containing protein [Microvirga makkahensis]|uniref:Uncharacterized protein n=1 Tax=Microvirga makkahensis TaxID=1128670 RepID=A0A7X3SNM4_9HYPH|nr:DUF167 domain-containing protein [Microvirga makkahensis]MXQ11194.1 hypothetical protein [Microvirga makkahensis]
MDPSRRSRNPRKGRAEDGIANGAVRRLLAKALRLPASAVSLEQADRPAEDILIAGEGEALARDIAALTGQNP